MVEHDGVARPGGIQRPGATRRVRPWLRATGWRTRQHGEEVARCLAAALLWPAAAWLVRAEEGRSKESSGSDGVPARVSHGERDAEERKREASE